MVSFLHAALAALIGLASALMWALMPNGNNQVAMMGLIGVELILVPLTLAPILGLLFRSAGRGQTMLRTADAACIVVGLVGLSTTAGSIQWLIGVTIATLATAGFLMTFVEPAPHRAGWRSHRDDG
jgi:hypothetical protein